jgi:hypothetical protein
MGNEDKIKDLNKTSKSQFLPAELGFDETVPVIYSLDDEFAKTKKNRNFFLYALVLGFMSFLIFGTYILTTKAQREQKDSDIRITEFEDLKLRELLDTAKNQEKKIERAQEEYRQLQETMDKQLAATKSTRYKSRIRQKYGKLLADKKTEITKLEDERKNYDLRLKDTVRKAEEMVNNYQKLVRLKMDAQRNYYQKLVWQTVMKYNPVFENRELERIVHSRNLKSERENLSLLDYKDELIYEKVITKNKFDAIQKNINNQLDIMDRMLQIPYRHSVKPALLYMDRNSRAIIQDYELFWSNLLEVVRKKNQQIKNYQNAFDYLAKTRPEGGYIVDPLNPERISVYINTILKVKDGDRAMVFRRDDEYIGMVEFFTMNDKIYAKTIESVKDKQIRPFDKLLIKMEYATKFKEIQDRMKQLEEEKRLLEEKKKDESGIKTPPSEIKKDTAPVKDSTGDKTPTNEKTIPQPEKKTP